MKTIIAGSRNIKDYDLVRFAIQCASWQPTEIVSGHARGVDQLAERYAKEFGISLKLFPADWKIGKHAGLVRNCEMAKYADALIAIWDGESKGTAHMRTQAIKHSLRIFTFFT